MARSASPGPRGVLESQKTELRRSIFDRRHVPLESSMANASLHTQSHAKIWVMRSTCQSIQCLCGNAPFANDAQSDCPDREFRPRRLGRGLVMFQVPETVSDLSIGRAKWRQEADRPCVRTVLERSWISLSRDSARKSMR